MIEIIFSITDKYDDPGLKLTGPDSQKCGLAAP
jgi:hypothetical protein